MPSEKTALDLTPERIAEMLEEIKVSPPWSRFSGKDYKEGAAWLRRLERISEDYETVRLPWNKKIEVVQTYALIRTPEGEGGEDEL